MHPNHPPLDSSRLETARRASPSDQPDPGTPAATPGRSRSLRRMALDPAATDGAADNGPASARLPAARPSRARPAHTAEEEPFRASAGEPYPPAGPVAFADEAYPDTPGRYAPARPAASHEPTDRPQPAAQPEPTHHEPAARPEPATPARPAAGHEPTADARTVSREGWLEEPALGEHAVDDLDDAAEVSTAALAGTGDPDETARMGADPAADTDGRTEPGRAFAAEQAGGPFAAAQPGSAEPPGGSFTTEQPGGRSAPEQPGGVDEPVAAVAGRRPGDVAASPTTLWSEDSAQRLRAEWQEVAARFIDEPQEALDAAQILVTRAVRELADALLAEQGEADPRRLVAQPDTEAMRMAMRGYREFLDRILAL